MEFKFFDGEEREPTKEEVAALVCKTQSFFSDELESIIGDSGISVKAVDIDWDYNDSGQTVFFTLAFAADVKLGNGQPADENDVFQALKVADHDLHSYIVDYISKIQPPTGKAESVFFSVNEVNFESAQNVPIPAGKLPNGFTDACTSSADSTSSFNGESTPYRGVSGTSNDKTAEPIKLVRFSLTKYFIFISTLSA